jgi:hypothetical protein
MRLAPRTFEHVPLLCYLLCYLLYSAPDLVYLYVLDEEQIPLCCCRGFNTFGIRMLLFN